VFVPSPDAQRDGRVALLEFGARVNRRSKVVKRDAPEGIKENLVSESGTKLRACDISSAGPEIPGWITPELLAETQQVWSEVYGREVSAAEATEILLNVKRLASTMRRSQ
jgi:hypothetical protein